MCFGEGKRSTTKKRPTRLSDPKAGSARGHLSVSGYLFGHSIRAPRLSRQGRLEQVEQVRVGKGRSEARFVRVE